MVFNGTPSKACERCRVRRLRCDQQRPGCTTCLRAGEVCVGYRPTDTVRIKDQTEFVRSKALAKTSGAAAAATQKKQQQQQQPAGAPRFRHLPQDLQVLGREVFFAHYVSDFSRRWEFLNKYLKPSETPEHLALGIDAVGLAFLSHQIASPTARQMGRRKYGEALRKTNKFLQNPESVNKKSAFESALVLDLYEKFAKLAADDDSPSAHVEGALALVKLRGVDKFNEVYEIKTLMGLMLNAATHALSRGLPVSDELSVVQKHIARFVDPMDPRWRLAGIILGVTNLAAEMQHGSLTPEERIKQSLELERQLESVDREAAPIWTYERKFTPEHGGRLMVPDGFLPVYDIYPDRTVTQMWNVLRMMRILLCEEIIESSAASQDPERAAQSEHAELTIQEVVRDICASVPQMTNCDFAAQHKLPDGTEGHQHTHTVTHMLDVYVLMFCLYVVAWSRHCPAVAHDFAVGQLRHIAEHFGVKEAATTLGILKQQELEERDIPWKDEGGGLAPHISLHSAERIKREEDSILASPPALVSRCSSTKPTRFARILKVYYASLDRSMYWAYEPRL